MAYNAEQAVKRYTDSMGSQQTKQKYIDGINSVQVNPMELAAAQEDKYLARVQESVTSGKRRRKLLAVPLSRYKNNAVSTGANRLGDGAKKSVDKVREHHQKFGPVYEAASAAARAIPGTGRDVALAKVAASMNILMDAAGRA